MADPTLTWWCFNSQCNTCAEFGLGRGIPCEHACHGATITGTWVAELDGEIVSAGDTKKEVLAKIGVSTSTRLDTGVYQAGDHIVRKPS